MIISYIVLFDWLRYNGFRLVMYLILEMVKLVLSKMYDVMKNIII